ncbi:MAG: tRNA lysidine(34) synthetase TilS [Candidatus Acidiferrales bacterium]
MHRHPLEQLLLARIREQQVIPAGARVAIAVSGGADSVALFHLLKNIHAALGITLSVAHFDHLLRGAESKDDSRFVAELAKANGVEFFVERENVSREAHRKKLNLEDAGRRLRYGFFQRLVEQGLATQVAVAHTADDQAETVLAQVIRGTGPTGLAGIYPVAGAIVRPLLEFRRQELRAYLSAMGQTWREDSTNSDGSRLRSRIRFRLLPQMQEEFSGRIVEHLCALAQLSREECVFWDALVERCSHALVTPGTGSAGKSLTIRAADLLNPLAALVRPTNLPAAGHNSGSAEWRTLTERLTRRLYKELKGDSRGLTLTHIQQVIRLASRSTSGKSVRLAGGISVQRNFEALLFSKHRTDSTRQNRQTDCRHLAYQYPIRLEKRKRARVALREIGVCLHLKTVDWGKTRSETTGESQVLDIGSIRAPLILRNWLPGDAYTPLGRSRPRKLTRMLLAARVPRADRKWWPVLESAGQLIWALGLPPARDFCAGEQTRTALVIEEEGIA